jgi:hypothetical protein
MNSIDGNDFMEETSVNAKRLFQTPVLSEYGDIQQIAESTQSSMGSGDNHQANGKTGPLKHELAQSC